MDQLEKLFALKKTGVLTDAEFEAEKARILTAERPGSRNGTNATDNPDAVHQAEIAPDRRRYFASTSTKAIAVLILFLAVGIFAWQAARNDWFDLFGPRASQTSSNAETDDAAEVEEQSSQDDLPSEDVIANDAAFSWRLKSENGVLDAYYGQPETSASFSLTCLAGEKQIEFAEWEIDRPLNMDGRISAGRDKGYGFSGYYNDDEVYSTFAFQVPADHELWTELAKGDSDLTVSLDGAKSYDLPKSPVLSEFVSKCRAKM